MARTLTAVFDGSVLRPEAPPDLKPNTRYRLRVEQELARAESENAWDTLEALIGTEQQSADWAAEHDHMSTGESAIRERLVARGRELCDPLTGNQEADKLLKDLEHHPHAFVIGCIMQRRVPAERAWLVPYRLAQRIGSFHFARLCELSHDDLRRHMTHPEPLHFLYKVMSRNLHAAIQHIADKYQGDASTIWAGTPSSAALVGRFREFHGVGQKISTMAANILVRDFKIPVSDSSIDISVDAHICHVFRRLGLVPESASAGQIISRARELYPQYPGLLDLPVWEVGRDWCRPRTPLCSECYMQDICPTALRDASS